jgi:aspartate racemase
MAASEKVVGVIGGMGPEATVEFMRRVVAATPARDDADHIHVIADNNPKIPSRIAALIERRGEDPAPVLKKMAEGLERAGADFLVMPCNTAHYYLPAIAEAVTIPVLDMVALSIARLAAIAPRPRRIGMLASPAVKLMGLFEARLRRSGFEPLFPGKDSEDRLLDVIRAVKGGNASAAQRTAYAQVAKELEQAHADAFLIACTELSVLGAPAGISRPVLDTLDVLVDATIAEARGA